MGSVRRFILIVATAAGILAVGTAALAQAEDPPAADPGYTVDIEIGLAGYAHPDEALPVVVDITSEELIVGRLEVASGGTTVSEEVEVPAGSIKQYVVEGAAPGSRRQVSVSLIRVAGDTEEVLDRQSLRVVLPADEVLVGVLDVDGIDTNLRSAASAPMGRKIVPLTVTGAAMEAGGGPLSYLVVGDAGSLSPDAVTRLSGWIRGGGRVIGAPAELDEFAALGSGDLLDGAPAEISRLGLGELIVVEDPASLSVDAWSAVLRDLPPLGLVRRDTGFGFGDASLVAAATAGREASVPALPWLLAGILLFVVLVGPVNFMVLRRLERPELAWLTVPVLSLAFVAAFWFVGRAQLQPFTVTSAAVRIDDGFSARSSGALVLQTESGGDHELELPATWQAVPAKASFGLQTGNARTADGRSVVDFELEDLGVGVAQAQWEDAPVEITIEIAPGDRSIDVTVTNGSDLDFWSWGVVVDGTAIASDEALAPGSTGLVTARTLGLGFSSSYEPIMSAAVQRKLFYADEYTNEDFQALAALSGVAEDELPGLRRSGLYFFGFTDQIEPELAVDGQRGAAPGTTLVVKVIPRTDELMNALGRARPDVLAVTGASTVEEYDGRLWAYGAEEVVLRYVLPTELGGAVRVDPGTTQLREVDVFDWAAGEFVATTWAADLTPYVSAGGELVVRGHPQADRFFDEGLVLNRFAAEWESP